MCIGQDLNLVPPRKPYHLYQLILSVLNIYLICTRPLFTLTFIKKVNHAFLECVNILIKRKTRDTKSDSCTSSVHDPYIQEIKKHHMHSVHEHIKKSMQLCLVSDHNYIRKGEHIVSVFDYFTRVDQSNIFVGFTNLLIIFSLNLSTH